MKALSKDYKTAIVNMVRKTNPRRSERRAIKKLTAQGVLTDEIIRDIRLGILHNL